MLKKNTLVLAVTYVLCGSLLQFIAGVSDTIWTNLVTIFGFILFLVGLRKLKPAFDRAGQSAIGLLMVSAVIGAVAGLFDLIPWIGGTFAGFLYMIAFSLEVAGYFMLRNSGSLGREGRNGVTMLLVALFLAVFQALVGIIPFLGDFIAGFLAIISIALVFFAWIKIQEDVLTSLYGDQEKRWRGFY